MAVCGSVGVDTMVLSPERVRILKLCEELSTDSLRIVELFASALVLCKGECRNALIMRKYLRALAEIVVDYVPVALAEPAKR